MSVAGEHFVSAAVHRRLAQAFQSVPVVTPGGPRVVAGLARGARHELGVLAFSLVLRSRGVPVTYLGGDLPLEAWVGTVRLLSPAAVVLAAPTVEDLPAVREAGRGAHADDVGPPRAVRTRTRSRDPSGSATARAQPRAAWPTGSRRPADAPPASSSARGQRVADSAATSWHELPVHSCCTRSSRHELSVDGCSGIAGVPNRIVASAAATIAEIPAVPSHLPRPVSSMSYTCSTVPPTSSVHSLSTVVDKRNVGLCPWFVHSAATLWGMYTAGRTAQLTGVPRETLRKWEQRYGVVEPVRSEGNYRLYDDEAVRRLSVMRDLVDAGWAPRIAARKVLEEPTASASVLPPRVTTGRRSRTSTSWSAARATSTSYALESLIDKAFAQADLAVVVDEWLMPSLVRLGRGLAARRGQHRRRALRQRGRAAAAGPRVPPAAAPR